MRNCLCSGRKLSGTNRELSGRPAGYGSSYPLRHTGLMHAPCMVVRRPATVANATVDSIKQQLSDELKGLDRGIFGVTAAKRSVLHDLVSELEYLSPIPAPVDSLDNIKGEWRLLYSTITITGVKRTKLGLREFVRLGDFIQTIDTDNSLAVNRVGFSVSGLGLIKGSLTITASYQRHDDKRVDIDFKEASLVPVELQTLFNANYDLLLSIFNPQGWLDITYLDDHHRVGRDDKGNIFYLERILSSDPLPLS